MRDAQGGESALKLGARIAVIAGGLVAKQGQPIGIEGHRQAVEGEGATEVLEVVPGRVGGNKDGGQEFAGMIINREQKGLFVLGGPPLMDRGVMLPQFAQTGSFPTAAGLGGWRGRADQEREVTASVGGDRF